MEQFMIVERLSIAVKLKADVEELENERLAGEFRVTEGGWV